MPTLSVLIVSYNTRDLLNECLRAIHATVRVHDFEVIVADNASADGTQDMLRREWPSVRVIETGANLGFARGMNTAMAAAQGDCLLLLNSDTHVLPEALDTLVDFLNREAQAGAAAPMLLNTDLTDQGTARAFPTPWAAVFGRKALLTRLFPNNRWSRRYMVGRHHVGAAPFAVDWVSGACLMVRRDVLQRVGPLDEGFFMYWEDADWCRRMRAAGYQVFCVPMARVIHHEGQSSKRQPAKLVWTFHRSVYRYYRKHEGRQHWLPVRSLVAGGLFGRAALIIAANRLAGWISTSLLPARSPSATANLPRSR